MSLPRTLLALWLLSACGTNASSSHAEGHDDAGEHEGHHKAGTWPVTHPLRKSVDLVQPYVAQIRAHQHIEVRALERGYLKDVHVDEGQTIAEGAPMFQVVPMVYDAELQRAAAEADHARIEYRNTELLADAKVVAPTELALAKARLARADAERAVAQAHRDLSSIEAPFTGIMGRLEVRRGSLLEEGELLTTLSDNRVMWVYFNVSEAEYLDYKRRMDHHEPFRVQLRLANGELFEHEGVVETIEADFNPETGNIAFRATFPNPGGLLRHGETGTVLVRTTVPDALVIPQKATFSLLDKTYVFVVDDAGVAHSRAITIAHELPHLYVVGSGLTAEDRVLLDGLRKVRDGRDVATAFTPPEEVLASLELHAE